MGQYLREFLLVIDPKLEELMPEAKNLEYYKNKKGA